MRKKSYILPIVARDERFFARMQRGARVVSSRLWGRIRATHNKYHFFRARNIGSKAMIARAFYARPETELFSAREAMRKETFCAWLYYPKPAEAEKFAESIRHLTPNSLAERFPGTVGVIAANVFPARSPKEPALIHITAIQGSFIQGITPSLSRSLVSKHGGWREHLLEQLFRDANAIGVRRISFRPITFGRHEPRFRRQAALFLQAARKHGFRRVEKQNKNVIFVEKSD